MSFSYLKGPKEPVRFLAPFLFLLLLSGCVSGGSAMQAELNQIKHDLYSTKKEVATLKKEVADLKKSSPGESKVKRDTELINALRESQTSLYSKVTALQDEIQLVYGGMDEQSHHSRQSLTGITSELDLIKLKLEETDSGPSLKDIEARLVKLESSGVTVKAPSGIKNTPSTLSPEQTYQAAYSLFEEKKYSAAHKAMEEFIKINSTHTLAGNAQFWIGEIHYTNKQYNNAILAYQDVLEKYPKSNKIPASMLKQAYAFIQLGDKKAAKGILNNLVQKYPKSDMTGYAKKKLKQLK
ncbi:tol-pal system protein YbgF [Nitrospirota bacterium]